MKRLNLGSRKSTFRLVFVTLIVLNTAFVGISLVSGKPGDPQGKQVVSLEDEYTPSGITVITTTNFKFDDVGEDGQIVAVAPNGSVLYRNTTYEIYDDVDPSATGDLSVTYVSAKHLEGEVCGPEHNTCSRNVIERVNLSTGEVTRLFAEITPGIKNTRWHDADRIDEHRFVLGDIANNRVSIVNVTSNEVTPIWNASEQFSHENGGPYPDDWTHLNDVEMLPDGRIMVSLRNFDQVVFLSSTGEFLSTDSLGSEGRHSVLDRQHNPDFIPADRGGPAALVADSQNNRIIEYQRRNGQWVQTWNWRDERIAWPRDADRLPNGNTLITDTNGDRVLEIDRSGNVVWSVAVNLPYEAERLGTGDESAGGQAAQALGLKSRSVDSTVGPVETLRASLPPKLVNGVVYILPPGLGFEHAIALAAIGLLLLVWVGGEIYWQFGVPVR